MTEWAADQHGTPLASTDGHTTPDLYRRVLRYVHIPDHVHAGRTVKGATTKTVARELAEYADWRTGAGAYPSIAMLAVGAQVDYRTAAAAVAALIHFRLIGLTETGGGRTANTYQLLNPMTADVEVLNPDRFRQAADGVQEKAKGRRRKVGAGPEPAAAEPPVCDVAAPCASPDVTPVRDVVVPPPLQGPLSKTTTDRVALVTHDRAGAREANPDPDTVADQRPEAPDASARATTRNNAQRRSRLRAVPANHAAAIARAHTEPRERTLTTVRNTPETAPA